MHVGFNSLTGMAVGLAIAAAVLSYTTVTTLLYAASYLVLKPPNVLYANYTVAGESLRFVVWFRNPNPYPVEVLLANASIGFSDGVSVSLNPMPSPMRLGPFGINTTTMTAAISHGDYAALTTNPPVSYRVVLTMAIRGPTGTRTIECWGTVYVTTNQTLPFTCTQP